ncbi:MAG: queuosine precursor transporter [archaeon]|nr:queuosine precursor transporter [archaeon]
MKKNEINFAMVGCVFVTALVTSNILASKVIHLGPLEVPAAIVAYPFTFLMTDVIGEIWGKAHAQKIVYVGIMCQIISLAMIGAAIYLPPADYMAGYNEEYRNVLGSTARTVFASLVGFMCSQTCDVILFHKLRELFTDRKWLRNNASTMCSQVVDSVVFVTIAFWGMGMNLPVMIVSQIIVKWIIALIDTPIFYALTRGNSPEKTV